LPPSIELISDPAPQDSINEISYEFDDDSNTITLLKQLNYLSLEDNLKAKALIYNAPDHSFAHPSNEPFTLSMDTDLACINVLNGKNKKAMSICHSSTHLFLTPSRIDFDLDDFCTCSLLCSLTP
jgi:hypothetical protein